MKPPSAEADMRTEFGPAAARIAARIPGSQAPGFWVLVPGMVCARRKEGSPL